MSRLPTVAGDGDAWGSILNDYLSQSLNSVGGITSALTATFSVSGATLNYHTVESINGQNNLLENKIAPAASGAVQQVGLYLSMTGSTTLPDGIFRIPLALRAQTGGGAGADDIEGMNIAVQQNLADDVAFCSGLELSFNNLKRNDPLNPVDKNHYGMTIDAYGGFSIGPAALAIRIAGAAGSNWQRGLWIPANSITPAGYAFDYEGNGTNGAVRIGAESQMSIGGAFTGDPKFHIQGAWTGASQTEAFRVNPSLTGNNNASVFGLILTPTMIESGGGTHPQLTGIYVAPSFTNGAAATTNVVGVNIDTIATAAITPSNAIALRIALPTGAANNYVFDLPADATDPTGGGGAATGRIRCQIGGVLRYLAYY